MDQSPRYRPLYRQVQEFLVKRIATGEWAPGGSLPSEQALAGRLNVSQGTVGKVLDDRVERSLEGVRVEWRTSRCDTTQFVYAVNLS